MSGSATPRGPLARDLLATVALAAYSGVVALGFARVFSGWPFLADLLVIVLVGHGLSFALRRLGTSAWVAVPVLAIVLVGLVAAQHYRDTLAGIVPTTETWDLFRLDLDLVREQFRTTVAPVNYDAGWAALSGLAMALVVVLADTFAFRADARGEALVPGGVLFVFIAALGYDRSRVLLTAALVGTGVVAVVALRALHEQRRRVELVAVGSPRGRAVPAALGVAAVVAVAAWYVGPRVPGADAEALYDTRGRSGGVTEVLSPLVTIRSRLVNDGNVELFRVTSTSESYWRWTTLPEFDGEAFRLPDRPLERVDGSFGEVRPDATEIRHEIEVRDLGGQLVPAAADPVAASGSVDLRWNADVATLVTVGREVAFGDRFSIVSSSPRLEPSQLRAATSSAPPDPIYLGLPDDFPSSVTDQARELTAGATTTYDAALALQTFFREQFTYSTEVQSGHGTEAIEVFLRDRIGYCEQFAATFAAMARSVGIPARVAVGFTAGLQTPDGRYSVLGRNAHAWPEVWFDGIGWVPFEPTPGRGAPGTEQYTGVAPEQDTRPAQPGDGDGETSPAPTTLPTAVPPTIERDPLATAPDGLVPSGEPVAVAGTDGGGPGWTPFVVAGVAALALALPAVVRRLRRRRRASLAPEEQVLAAWRDATAAARRAGVDATDAMTPHEWARATAHALPVAARPMHTLAETVDTVAFAPPGRIDLEATGPYGTSTARTCTAMARQIEMIADDGLRPRERVVRYFTEWN